jgi:hypothetical protein
MDGNRMSYAYQWKRGGVNISGATANTYTLVTADIGAMITATVTATNAAGSASATAAGVGPVTAGSSTALQAQAGSFAFAGQSATLTPPVGGGALSIQAQPGSFAVSGESMQIVISYVMQVGAGSFAMAGQSATLTTGSGAAFTPASLANLYAWYKSDAGVTYTGTIGVDAHATSWADQSGVSNVALTKVGAASIGYGDPPDVLNGKNVLSGGGGAYFTATMALGNTTGPGGASQLSVWAVFKAVGTFNGRLMAYASSGGSDTAADGVIPAFYPGSGTPTGVNAYSNAVKSVNNTLTPGYHRIMSIFNGTDNTIYIDDTAGTTVGSTNVFTATGTVAIFTTAPTVGGNDVAGNIAELVIVKGALSAGDMTNLKNYCLTRWGV